MITLHGNKLLTVYCNEYMLKALLDLTPSLELLYDELQPDCFTHRYIFKADPTLAESWSNFYQQLYLRNISSPLIFWSESTGVMGDKFIASRYYRVYIGSHRIVVNGTEVDFIKRDCQSDGKSDGYVQCNLYRTKDEAMKFIEECKFFDDVQILACSTDEDKEIFKHYFPDD